MSKDIKTTKSGDRKRHREAMRRQPPRKPLEGNHIRARAVLRKDVDVSKLSLAVWLLAQGAVRPADSDGSDKPAEQDR